MAKTVSSRIPKDLHDKLMERCKNAGCNTNDIIRGLLELELWNYTEIDFGNEEETASKPDNNPTPKEEPKPTVNWLTDVKVVEI